MTQQVRTNDKTMQTGVQETTYKKGRFEVERKRINLNRSAIIANRFKLTELHQSVNDGDLSKVSTLLLNPRVSIDAQDSQRYTPLHYALTSDNIEIAMLLVQKGARFDIKSCDGTTALEIAIENKQKEVIMEMFNCKQRQIDELQLRNDELEEDRAVSRQHIQRLQIDRNSVHYSTWHQNDRSQAPLLRDLRWGKSEITKLKSQISNKPPNQGLKFDFDRKPYYMRENNNDVVKLFDPYTSSQNNTGGQEHNSCRVSMDFGPRDIMDLLKLNSQLQDRIATLLDENYDLRMNLARDIQIKTEYGYYETQYNEQGLPDFEQIRDTTPASSVRSLRGFTDAMPVLELLRDMTPSSSYQTLYSADCNWSSSHYDTFPP